jgi:pimeloyl-ACP methyl ester carboxylesterase
MRRWAPLLLLLLLLLSMAYALTPRGRALGEAIAILADVWSVGSGAGAGAAGGRGPAALAYAGPGGERREADLYCEEARPAGARLVLVHGLIETGKDDARLRALGRAFARHRFLVVVPDFPGMRALRASPGDIEEVRAALAAARGVTACRSAPGPGRPAPDPGGSAATSPALPTGVVGFSYSAGPVLLALDGARPAGGADFAVLFGGYYDLRDVLLFLTTGRHRDRGIEEDGEALPEGRWVLLGANAETVADPADRAALRAISALRQRDPRADISDLSGSLGPGARAVLNLVANTDPGRFDALLERGDPALRQALDALSPSRRLTEPLGVDLYLLHGRSDAIVPYTQSLKLQRSVRTTGTVRLALLGGFRHARPEREGEARWWTTAWRHPADSLRLLAILSEILARRTEGPARISLTGAGPDRR